MADDTQIFRLDLDAKDFIDAITDAQSRVSGLGDAKNLQGLIDGFDAAIPLLGAMGVAFAAVKTAMGAVFDAEQIKAVNQQFEVLTENAGLSGASLKQGLEQASAGLIDETSLLKMANQAIVAMGASASQLPQLMELARKASVVTGQDITTTFQQLTRAVETGNQRLLTGMGLRVDVTKAEQAYADTLGISVDALSQQGKNQAILNAVLEKGRTAFQGINTDILASTNMWQQLKATLLDIKDSLVLVFEKYAGPAVQGFITILRGAALQLKAFISGNDVDAAKARLHQIVADSNKAIEAQKQAAAGGGSGGNSAAIAAASVDQQKLKQLQTKFQADILAIKKQALADDEKVAMSEADVDRNLLAQKELAEEQYQQKLSQIETNKSLSKKQRLDEELSLASSHEKQLTALTLDAESTRQQLVIKSYENQVKAAQGAFNKMQAGAALFSQKAKASLLDFAGTGASAAQSLSKNVGDAFEQMGEGTKSVGDAMKGAIIGAIADQAQAQGAFLIASSIFPPNPLGLAAGAGLEVLAGLLKSLAGSSNTSSSSLPTSSGVSSAGGGLTPSTSLGLPSTGALNESSPTAAQASQAVNIVIQGSYFDSAETQTRLTQLIRQSADATDFKVQSIGGGL